MKIKEIPRDEAMFYCTRNFKRLKLLVDWPYRLPMFLGEWMSSPKRHRFAQRSQRMIRGQATQDQILKFHEVASAAFSQAMFTPFESNTSGEIALAYLGAGVQTEARSWACQSIVTARREDPPITAVLVLKSMGVDDPYSLPELR